MRREVLIYPDPRLYEKSIPVYPDDLGKEFDAPWGKTTVKELAADLVETMEELKGAGIAAVQVGVPLAVIVVVSDGSGPLAMVNPEWSGGTTLEEMDEGCLSFPGIVEKVRRFRDVTTTYQTPDGTSCFLDLSGVPAQAVQHEAEHLDGRLFIEHLSIVACDRIRTKFKKWKRASNRAMKRLQKAMGERVALPAEQQPEEAPKSLLQTLLEKP